MRCDAIRSDGKQSLRFKLTGEPVDQLSSVPRTLKTFGDVAGRSYLRKSSFTPGLETPLHHFIDGDGALGAFHRRMEVVRRTEMRSAQRCPSGRSSFRRPGKLAIWPAPSSCVWYLILGPNGGEVGDDVVLQ